MAQEALGLPTRAGYLTAHEASGHYIGRKLEGHNMICNRATLALFFQHAEGERSHSPKPFCPVAVPIKVLLLLLLFAQFSLLTLQNTPFKYFIPLNILPSKVQNVQP